MTITDTTAIADVEAWNDTFARENDIDAYYARSNFLIRWIERRRLASIRRMAGAKPGHRVLEVGCGGGHVLRNFPDCDLTGVDVSGEMLQKAARNLAGYRVQLLKGQLGELDLPERPFDVVICTEVLEHVVDPEQVLEQARLLLGDGGRAVITFPNDRFVNRCKTLIRYSGLSLLPSFRRVSWGGDVYHLHVWRPREMQQLLSRYFRVEQACYIPSRMTPIRCCFQCSPRK